MARAVRRPFRGGRARKAGGTWTRIFLTPSNIAGSTKQLSGSLVLANAGIAETVRRTVGHVIISSDQVAAKEVVAATFGMIVVSDLALAAGAASIPGPVTDRNDDGWFVYQPLSVIQGIDSSVQSKVYDVDSKGMRRVEEGFGIAIMFETGTVGATVQVAVSVYSTRS